MRQVLSKRGYFLAIIGGRIKGFVKVNDTNLQQVLKMQYGKKEYALMLQKLKDNPGKVPLSDQKEMINLLNDAKKDRKLIRAHHLNQYGPPTLSMDQKIIW